MRILYDAKALFDIDDIELDVPDSASEEDIVLAIFDDLESRYDLLIRWRKKEK